MLPEQAGWVAHPRRKPGLRTIEDVNYIVVEGELLPPPPKSRQAACFFVHDTTYNPPEAAAVRSRDGVGPLWNAPVAPVPADFKVGAYSSVGLGNLAAKIDEMAEFRTIMGAAPFVRSCKIYAPRYRQANVLAFMPKLPHVFENRESAHKALRLAYDDVKRSFEHFLYVMSTEPLILLSTTTLHNRTKTGKAVRTAVQVYGLQAPLYFTKHVLCAFRHTFQHISLD